MLATSQISVSDIFDGNGIASSIIDYAVSSSGTQPPGNPITDGYGNPILDNNGEPLTDGEWTTDLPTVGVGQYLWTRTRLIYTDGTFDMIYTVSQHGSTGPAGAHPSQQNEQWYLSNSPTSLTGGTWGYEEPSSIPSGKYLWGRLETVMSDGTIMYSDAVYRSSISGLINLTDEINGKITQKIWQSDIDSTIEDYDNPTGTSSLRDRVTQTESDISGITQTVGQVQSTLATKADGFTVTTLQNDYSEFKQTMGGFKTTVESSYAQLSDLAAIKVGGNNLYIIADETPGYIAATGGTINAQDNTYKYFTSDYIPVKEGEHYILQCWATPNAVGNSWLGYQYYSNNTGTPVGNRIAKGGSSADSGVEITANGMEHLIYSITIPTGVNYLRMSYRRFDDGCAMIEKATIPSEYSINAQDVDNKIANIKVGGNNLYVIADEIPGYVAANGTISSQNSTYKEFTSAYIPVQEDEDYIIQSWATPTNETGGSWLAYQFYANTTGTTVGARQAKYGKDSNSGVTITAEGQEHLTYSVKVPQNANYLRVSYRKFNDGYAMVEKATIPSEYSINFRDLENYTDSQVSSVRTIAEQTADKFEWIVESGTSKSDMVLTDEALDIIAENINLTGKVTFNSMDSTLQNRVTTAENNASTAATNAANAVSTANTANTNASNAVTAVNNSIKSTTMHYLATSASSGVTRSTSGWTTTIQSIDATKRYLWTYQTITKVNNTTTDTDPVISGVWGNTGGQGNPGVSVTKVEQLYRTSSSTTAPTAPTSLVTSTSTTYNTWTLAMPEYNASYPYYYTCTQTTYSSGNPTWTTPSRCKAIEDANVTANSANTTANTANTNASNAVSTANTANTNASNAVTTANTANTTANNAATSAATANEKANPGLGMKVNYSTFSTENAGECYIHGYTNGAPADVNGYVYWNGVKRTVPKRLINPEQVVPYQTTCYIVLRLSSATATTGTVYMVWYSSGWKYAVTPHATDGSGTWEWSETTDIVLGQFVETASEGQMVDAYLYNPPRNASHILTTGNNPYQYAKNSVDWVSTNGSAVVTAKNIVDSWKGVAENNVTTINGGLIQTHTILAKNLATNAIMSENYSSGTQNQDTPSSTDNPAFFSQYGTFMDLANGNIYSPNFTVINSDPFPNDSNVVTPGTFMNGTVHASAGYFGTSTQHWNIEKVYDYNNVAHAALVGVGSPYIQTGNWQISDNQISTKKYTSTAEATGTTTYYKDASSNTFYDVGVKIPTNFTAPSDQDGKDVTFAKSFFYGRKYTGNNVPAFDDDWSYLFMVDNAGNLYEKGQLLSERYAAIGDVEGAYVSTTGGTVNGNLTVTGTLTATASAAVQLSSSRNLNVNLANTSNDGKVAFDGSANVTLGITGTLGVDHGGTGATTFASGQALIGNGTGAIQTRGIRNNLVAGNLGWTAQNTDNTLVTTNTIAYWNGRYNDSSSNLEYVKLGKLGTVVTHNVEEFITSSGGTVNGALTVTDLTAGSLVVNGGATFTNGLTGDLTGNVVGTASNATKVGNNLIIKLNDGTTEGTNMFTFNGSAAKTVNITKSNIGLNNVENTADADKNVLSAAQFTTAKTIALTGDTTGSVSSQGGWSIATTTKHLSASSNADFYTTGLQYAQGQFTIGTNDGNAKAGVTPSYKIWSYPEGGAYINNNTTVNYQGLRLYWNKDYFRDIFMSPNNNKIYHRAVSAGTVTSDWFTILDSDNYTDYTVTKTGGGATGNWSITAARATADGDGNTISSTYVKKAGDTMGGSLTFNNSAIGISRPGVSGMWKEGRDRALIKSTTPSGNSGYDAFASIRTFNGSWDISAYHADTYRDKLIFAYIPNTMYNGTNAVPNQIKFNTDGSITASLDGNATTATTAGSLTTARSFTVGKTEKSVKWDVSVSFSQAEISDCASNSANGWMSKEDKEKLDSISVTSGGTVVASNVTGSNGITVSLDNTTGIATVKHSNTAITAGTVSGTSNTGNVAFGSTVTIPKITYDAYGHITGATTTTVKLPAAPTTVSGNAGTATKFASEQSITLTGDTTGTASSQAGWSIENKNVALSALNSSWEAQVGSNNRPTTANVSFHDGKLRYFLATSAMTEGKPPGDARILHFAWDNTGWDVQLAATTTNNIYIRS